MDKDLKTESKSCLKLKTCTIFLITGLCFGLLSACSNDSGTSHPQVEFTETTPTTNDLEKKEGESSDDGQGNNSTAESFSAPDSQPGLTINLMATDALPSASPWPSPNYLISGSGASSGSNSDSASISGSSDYFNYDYAQPSYFPDGVEPLDSFSNDLVSLEKLSTFTTYQPTDDDIAQLPLPDFLQTLDIRNFLPMFENETFFSAGSHNFVLVTSLFEDVLLAIEGKDFVEILRQPTDVMSFINVDLNIANIMNSINSVSHLTILGTIELAKVIVADGVIVDASVDSHAIIIASPSLDNDKTKVISIGNNSLTSIILLELDGDINSIIERPQLSTDKARFAVNEITWETDGTIAGTVQISESETVVTNTNCGSSNNGRLLVDDAKVPLIVSNDGGGLLCRADNGEIIWSPESNSSYGFRGSSNIMFYTFGGVQAGDYQYFIAGLVDSNISKIQIWATDGSKQKTKVIYEVELDVTNMMSSYFSFYPHLLVFNDRILFQDVNSGEVMTASFDMVETFTGLPKGGLQDLRITKDNIHFLYTTNNPIKTNQGLRNLWVSDGTADGQKLLFDDILNFTVHEIAGKVFLYVGRLNAAEIWVGSSFMDINTKLFTLSTRPTDSGTGGGEEIADTKEVLEKDDTVGTASIDSNELVVMPVMPLEEPVEGIMIDAESSSMLIDHDWWYPRPPYFFSHGNTILFTRSESNDFAYNQEELWQTDGTVAGTQLLYSKDSCVPIPGYEVHWQDESNLRFPHNNEYWNLQLK